MTPSLVLVYTLNFRHHRQAPHGAVDCCREPEETKEPGEDEEFGEQGASAALPAPGGGFPRLFLSRSRTIILPLTIVVIDGALLECIPLQLRLVWGCALWYSVSFHCRG